MNKLRTYRLTRGETNRKAESKMNKHKALTNRQKGTWINRQMNKHTGIAERE